MSFSRVSWVSVREFLYPSSGCQDITMRIYIIWIWRIQNLLNSSPCVYALYFAMMQLRKQFIISCQVLNLLRQGIIVIQRDIYRELYIASDNKDHWKRWPQNCGLVMTGKKECRVVLKLNNASRAWRMIIISLWQCVTTSQIST